MQVVNDYGQKKLKTAIMDIFGKPFQSAKLIKLVDRTIKHAEEHIFNGEG